MKSHNFFIYSNFDFSRNSAGSTRMRYYAKALSNSNSKVFLISCCTNRFSLEDFEEIAHNVFILIDRKPTTNLYRTFLFIKRLDIFSKALDGDKTFIYYPYPLVFLEFFSLIYFKLYKGYAVFSELNEIPKYSPTFSAPITYKKPIYSLKKILFKVVFTLMQFLLFFYNGLICISTSMEAYARQFNNNIIRVPILTDPKLIASKSDKSYVKKNTFNLGFSGSIHPVKEDLENLINTITRLKEEGYVVSLNLCGDIFKDYVDDFIQICESRDEINYYGFLDQFEMSAFLSQQDLLVLPRGFNLQNKYGFSTKLSDYMNHQKLILATDISDTKLYLTDGKNGFIVPPNSPELMFTKLIYIIENFEKVKNRIISNAFATSKKDFYYKNYQDILRDFLMKNKRSE